MPDVTLRRATHADAPAIVTLVESAYRGDSSRAGWTTEADLLDGQRTDLTRVEAGLGRPDAEVLLADSPTGELLGCCQIERRAPGRAYFGLFAVRPQRQGHGLGRKLIGEAERVARTDWASTTMEMTVIAQRGELIAWYERCGYAFAGEMRPFPYDDVRAGLPKRPDLQFVVLEKTLLP